MSHRLTAEQLDAAACEWAERTAVEQGKPAGIEDPVWLDRLATFMTSTPGTSTSPPEDPAAGGRKADPTSPLGPPTGGPDPAAVDVAADSRGRAIGARRTA